MNVAIRNACLWTAVVLAALPGFAGDEHTVTAKIEVKRSTRSDALRHSHVVVLWLEPLSSNPAQWPAALLQQPRSLTQKNKSFEPHLLVVPVGSVVDFPNKDPFFHNVFSLFDGKRFDLGLYEAGSTRRVHFDRPGTCYIFCNIHSEMSAVVIVLATPYYAIADSAGEISIPHVASGHYRLHAWDERSLPEDLSKLTREVVISDQQSSLGTVPIKETAAVLAHTNKYGEDYEKPSPSSPVYVQP